MAFNKEKFENGECEICALKFKGRNGLARHIKWLHAIDIKEYFLTYGGEKVNCSCGKPSNWLGTNMEFSGYCSRERAMVIIRKAKRDDMTYRNNIAKAMRAVWAKRPPSIATIERRLHDAIVKQNTKNIYSADLILPENINKNLSNVFGMKYES